MKVLLVSPLPPPVGGDSTWAKKYIEYNNQVGRPISIVNTSVIGKRAQNVEDTSSVTEELKRAFGIWKNIWHELSRFKPDIVHMNTNCSPKGIIRDFISAVILNIRRVPFIVHCRCNVQDQLGESRIGKYFFKKLVAKSMAVIALNSKSHIYICSNTNREAIIIPNFIDSEYIRAETKSISESINTMLFVGHIRKTKGINEIIEAARNYPNKTFILAGPITKEIDVECAPINVQFTGNQTPDQVKTLLDTSDVFIFPSYTEGFANALLEAMARGLPCIASDVGANRDMLEEEGGMIIPSKDTASIIFAINAMEDKDLRCEMSLWNIQKVKANYSVEMVAERLQELYANSIQEKNQACFKKKVCKVI